MMMQMIFQKRRNKKVGVIVAFVFAQDHIDGLVLRRRTHKVVGEQLELGQEGVRGALVDEDFKGWAVVGGGQLACVPFGPLRLVGVAQVAGECLDTPRA